METIKIKQASYCVWHVLPPFSSNKTYLLGVARILNDGQKDLEALGCAGLEEVVEIGEELQSVDVEKQDEFGKQGMVEEGRTK